MSDEPSAVPVVRIPLCAASDLRSGEVRVVTLARDPYGKPREALVLLDEGGVPRAYRNLCNHLPVPLDAASRQFLKDGQLQCATHGARYRLRDGLCISGPCEGASLRALPLELAGDQLVLVDDDNG